MLYFGGKLVFPFAFLLLQALGGFEIDATEGLQLLFGNNLLNAEGMFRRQVGILVKLCLEALHLLEEVDELAACRVALEVRHLFRSALQPLSVHEIIELVNRSFKLVDDHRGCVNQPYLIGAFGFFAGKEGDGKVNRTFLLAEVENCAVRLGTVQDAIGT